MAKAKPNINITPTASSDNVSRQIQNVADYAESIVGDIATATTNNEVVQARTGFDSLSQRFEAYYRCLPVFQYENITIDSNKHITIGKAILWWRGKVYTEENLTYSITLGNAWQSLCFNINDQKFYFRQGFEVGDIQLVFFDREGIAARPVISVWKYDGSLVYHYKGSDPNIPSSNTIDDPVFFWVACRDLLETHRAVFNYSDIKFNRADIDFCGYNVEFRTWAGNSNMGFRVDRSKVRNIGSIEERGQSNEVIQPKVIGNLNYIELLDDSDINFDTPKNNAVSIPHNSSLEFYQLIAKSNNNFKIVVNGKTHPVFRQYTDEFYWYNVSTGESNYTGLQYDFINATFSIDVVVEYTNDINNEDFHVPIKMTDIPVDLRITTGSHNSSFRNIQYGYQYVIISTWKLTFEVVDSAWYFKIEVTHSDPSVTFNRFSSSSKFTIKVVK